MSSPAFVAPTGAENNAALTAVSFATFSLVDLAEAAATREGNAWGEDPGLNLLLEETLTYLRSEMLSLPVAIARHNAEKGISARSRLWMFVGTFSAVGETFDHLVEISEHADIYIIGMHDVPLPIAEHIEAIPVQPGSPLSRERGVVVQSSALCAALLAFEAGQLTPGNTGTNYCEGLISALPAVAGEAAKRLNALLGLETLPYTPDLEMALSWQSRVGVRLLEELEAARLRLSAREGEMAAIADERKRLESIVRSYVGTQTWREVTEAVEMGNSIISDRREELTMCFSDLVGFTQISERLHPAEVATILNDHYTMLSDIVRAHGGWVDKFIGDAMLAVFDRPLEAMQAAQKMVRETRLVNVTEQMTQPVQIRVGLNTGIVAVANLGTPERRERTVLGDAVNIAQRLQSAAHPQSILVSARTVSRLPYSVARSLEQLEVSVKGKRDPLVAYRWTLHADRRAPDKQLELREHLSNSARRTPLYERLRGLQNNGDRKLHGPSQDAE